LSKAFSKFFFILDKLWQIYKKIFANILATLFGYESFTSFARNFLFYNCYSYLSSRTFGRWHHCLGLGYLHGYSGRLGAISTSSWKTF